MERLCTWSGGRLRECGSGTSSRTHRTKIVSAYTCKDPKAILSARFPRRPIQLYSCTTVQQFFQPCMAIISSGYGRPDPSRGTRAHNSSRGKSLISSNLISHSSLALHCWRAAGPWHGPWLQPVQVLRAWNAHEDESTCFVTEKCANGLAASAAGCPQQECASAADRRPRLLLESLRL
jgi:hypothetical protein